jgi:hypothetical protein
MFASSSLATPKPIRKKKHKIAKASRIDDFIVFAPEKLIGLNYILTQKQEKSILFYYINIYFHKEMSQWTSNI